MSANDEYKPFNLRTSIQCHEKDLRCVSALPNGGFVTGSRDKTTKAYHPMKKTNQFKEVQNLFGPENFVASVCVLSSNPDESLIYVGSNDAVIYCFTLLTSDPKFKLTEHSGTVCSLSADDKRGLVLSGSWDHTSRLWSNEECIAVFVGHEAAVWATAFISDSLVITGSADKTLRVWSIEPKISCMATLKGHTDCVRGIAVLSKTEFVSCSNDASVRQWNTKGEQLSEYYGHENYIYSITILANGCEFASCSEDRTVRVWKQGNENPLQTIRLPATTLWTITALSNNDLVIGSSTGKAYVYTRDDNLKAKSDEVKALEEELAKSSLPVSDIGEIKAEEIPTIDSLNFPGKRDGQTKLVKDGDKVTVHSWDANKNEWIKIGDVVGAAGATKDPSQKEKYNGKEYDYVFSIDIEDGMPPLKLPYNITENPWMVAQTFIHEHNLSQLYLDQIANFIMKNSEGMQITQTSGNCDPFTGGNR